MAVIICALVLLNAVQFFMARTTVTRDSIVRDAFVTRARSELIAARQSASQVSRMGSSNTYRVLAITRQHLYGITQLNDMTANLLGTREDLLPQDVVNAAIRSVEACEARNLEGYNSDEQLTELQAHLSVLAEIAETL
ncbi:MAG: hypothetical protein FWG37_06415 [Clostridia bacterium]|nr:hypothetical protein [Clostridia bacterium]